MSRLWYEIWSRPGAAVYQRKIAEPPVITGGGTQGYSGVYQGSMTLPRAYARLNEILYTDAVTPASGVWSTVKLFSEASPTTALFEWLPSPSVPPQGKTDPNVEISGLSIDSIMGFARVEPWDWDGTAAFVSTFPDWVYGGRNLLSNPGMEESTCRPEVNQITLDPNVTGGTFTLSDGTDTTSGIAWNASAFTVETEIESDITALDDVVVTGAGTVDDPWVIEFVTPCALGSGLTANFASLTPAPGTSVLERTQFGALQPNPWTKSQVVSSGTPRIFGEYDSFRVTTAQARTGTYSLLIDPAPIGRRYAGAQQILNVKADGRYQASVWVFTASASQEYRLVIRGIDEDLLLDINGNPAVVQVTPAINTWTQLAIPDVVTGANTQIIFRIANINVSGNPAIFYVDDGGFNEGLAAATVGLMMEDLYDDATIDHVGRIVWEDDANPGTPYLTLDFTGTLDSDGAAWDTTQSLTFRPRMSYLQVLETIGRLDYEWRVLADAVPGQYLLQLFNPGTLGAIMPAGIQGGSSDITHNARYFAPPMTDVVVQGAGQLSARAQSAGLVTAFGLIEGSQLDLNVTSLTTAAVGASEAAAAQVRGAESLVYTLKDPATEPLVRYRAGDTINIEDPPIITGTRRVSSIDFAFDKNGSEYTVSLGSEALLGQAGINQQVGILLKKFQRADEPVDAGPTQIFGGGGMMTVAVAASNASASSQSKADYICDGVDDQVEIMEAINICYTAGGGTVWLSEGVFVISSDLLIVGGSIAYPEPMTLEGLGRDSTLIEVGSHTNFGIYVAQNCELRDLKVTGPGGT